MTSLQSVRSLGSNMTVVPVGSWWSVEVIVDNVRRAPSSEFVVESVGYRTLSHERNPIRPWTKSSEVPISPPDLSYSMEMKSCGVRRAVRISDGAIFDLVNESHLDDVILAHD